MSETLAQWEGRCAEVLDEIESEIARIRSHAQDESRLDSLHQTLFDDRVAYSSQRTRTRDENMASHADQGKQSAATRSFGSLNNTWGNILTGARPKRSAPGDPRLSVQDDEMDVDDDAGKLGNRSTRRKGGGR